MLGLLAVGAMFGSRGSELLVTLGRNLYISETVQVESIRFLIDIMFIVTNFNKDYRITKFIVHLN